MNEEEISQAISLPVSDEEEEREDNFLSFQQTGPSEGTASDGISNLSPELLSAYRIVDTLVNPNNRNVNLPFMNPIDCNSKGHKNYDSVIKNPMWLRKIHSNLLSGEYRSITEVIRDLRLVLENCYRFHGQNHPYVKKALKLDTIIEQKLALLPSNLRDLTELEVTSPRLAQVHHQIQQQQLQQGAAGLAGGGLSGRYASVIFQCVREQKAELDRERKREQMEERRAEREAAHQETLHWEEALLADHASDIRKMWELPQIGHFLYLAQRTLNLPEVSQYELERSLFMPAGSSLMAAIMTSLLSTPHQRAKLDQWPSMRYETWENRLKARLQHWYKVYTNKERNLLKVFELIGIEPEFFRIMGDENPIESKTFRELTLKQRIWVLKSLCDYCLHNHKTVQDSILEMTPDDQREAFLGEDKEGNEYVHFPQFCGQSLRIYRLTKDPKIPQLDLTPPPLIPQNESAVKSESVEDGGKTSKVEEEPKSNKANSRKRKGRRKNARVRKQEEKPAKPQPPAFELVVESVEALRNLMDCFVAVQPRNTRKQNTKGGKGGGAQQQKQPYCEQQLHGRLKRLLGELEPWEQKLEQAVIKSRLKLKKEWEDRRIRDDHQQEEVDEFWGEEMEEEVPIVVEASSSSSSFSEIEADPNASEFRQTHRRTCTRRKKRVWESQSASTSDSESEPFKITVSSRGRICKTRNFNFVPTNDKVVSGVPSIPVYNKKPSKAIATAKPTVTLNGMQPKQRDMLEAHRSQNSASDAQIQYQWETMRLKLLEENKESGKVKSEKVQEAVATKMQQPTVENEDVLDRDVFLSAGPDFGSWKSSVPGSAFAEQTFTTLLEQAPTYTAPPPPKPPKKVEIVRLTAPPPVPQPKPTLVPVSTEKPKLGIFRDKSATGNDGRFVKTTFTAPGILRSTISKRPSQAESPKPNPQQNLLRHLVNTTSAVTTNTTSTASITTGTFHGKPGQKILVLPIKDAAGNKVILQVLPKGSQPLRLSQFKGVSSAITKAINQTKGALPNNIESRLSFRQPNPGPRVQVATPESRQRVPNQNVTPNNNRVQVAEPNRLQLPSENHQMPLPDQNRTPLCSENNRQLLVNRNQHLLTSQNQVFSSQAMLTNQNQPTLVNQNRTYSNGQDPLSHAVNTHILPQSVSQEQILHNSQMSQEMMTQELVTHQIPYTPVSMSQELSANQILHVPVTQTTNHLLHPSVTQAMSNNEMVCSAMTQQDLVGNRILHSPQHDHFASNQNLSPPTNRLLTSPTDHTQLILQSQNTAQLLATSFNQNQMIQTSPNQILTSMSPMLTHPDGSVTLLTQGSGTMVLPVQTQLYAPQLYTTSEPKVIVCTNGQVLDGNVTQESLFVVTSSGQLVSMDNCTLQQTMLTEQMSPL